MDPIRVFTLRALEEFQVCLMDQSRGLQGVVSPLPAEVARGDLAKLFVQGVRKFTESIEIKRATSSRAVSGKADVPFRMKPSEMIDFGAQEGSCIVFGRACSRSDWQSYWLL